MKQKSNNKLDDNFLNIIKIIIPIILFLDIIVSLIKIFLPSIIDNNISSEILLMVLLAYYTYNNYKYN